MIHPPPPPPANSPVVVIAMGLVCAMAAAACLVALARSRCPRRCRRRRRRDRKVVIVACCGAVERGSCALLAVMGEHSVAFAAVLMVSCTNLDELSCLPWTCQEFEGFPDRAFLRLTYVTVLVQNVPQIVLQAANTASNAAGVGVVTKVSLCFSALNIVLKALARLIVIFAEASLAASEGAQSSTAASSRFSSTSVSSRLRHMLQLELPDQPSRPSHPHWHFGESHDGARTLNPHRQHAITRA